MPIRLKPTFEPDELDCKMRSTGFVSDHEAVIRTGRSYQSLAGLANNDVLRKQSIYGRVYYDADDVRDLAAGRNPSERHEAERADYWREFGLPPANQETPQPEPGDSFLSKFGGRRS